MPKPAPKPARKREKVERQLNLVICLLSTNQYVSAEYIRRNVGGYYENDSTDDAFFRMFERDKADLRDLGIPLITGPTSGFGENEDGYRIDRERYELPDIHLEPAEGAAVALATALWDSSEVAAIAQSAALKLRAAGIDVSADQEWDVTGATAGRGSGDELVLRELLEASTARRAVEMTFQRPGTTATVRRLEPWGVVTHRGRWYVVGRDRDRDERRTFRLSRITAVTQVGKAGAFTADTAPGELRALVAESVDQAFREDSVRARVWVAADRAAGLRRLASDSAPAEFDGAPGDELVIEFDSTSALVRTICSAGPDAVVLEPESLRGRVVAALDAMAAL
ncbi:WYL domain-containing protein [Gordonia sp. X0973]|uniref:helix-turn-helix transcriptional regulator n=1 Tax=Gordonia sp. X0973 TaxID=2742602 RepID=UPI000F545F87|nr:WYL domain-containing protein [Gordonia sp. X0973]QKT07431.1 WYL domain-containing protein [Gordonia sp. X0973]